MRKPRLRGERHLPKVTLLVSAQDSDLLFPPYLGCLELEPAVESHFEVAARAGCLCAGLSGPEVLLPGYQEDLALAR